MGPFSPTVPLSVGAITMATITKINALLDDVVGCNLLSSPSGLAPLALHGAAKLPRIRHGQLHAENIPGVLRYLGQRVASIAPQPLERRVTPSGMMVERWMIEAPQNNVSRCRPQLGVHEQIALEVR